MLLFCGCSAKKEVKTASGVEFIMNTFVEQRWFGENAQQTYDEIVSALKGLESKLSLYVDNSEISELNSAAGKHPVEYEKNIIIFIGMGIHAHIC